MIILHNDFVIYGLQVEVEGISQFLKGFISSFHQK